MKKILLISLVFVLMCGIGLSSCAEPEPTAPEPAAPAPATPEPAAPEPTAPETGPKYGGVIKLGSMALSASFGVPWNLRHGDRTSSFLPLELLVRRGQEPGTYEGRLAESWELAPDKSYYTFYLRQGVKFHDGTDFNAEAVKWNFEMAKAAGRPQFANVTSIDVIDTHTVRINISQWNSEFMHNFASDTDCALIISPASYEKNGEEWANTHPVGTGPYMLKEYKQDQYIYLEKNPDYWEEGIPYIDEIQILVVPDMVTFMAALKAGDLDGMWIIDFLTASQLEDDDRFNVWVSFGNLGTSLSYNMKDPASVWSDKKMREALEYAIDKEKICRALTYGYCEPTYEIIRGIHGAGDPGTVPREYDPEKAKQLMAEAGHPQVSGVNLEFSITDKNSYGDAYLAIQENFAAVGIEVELKPVEPAAFNESSFRPTEGNDLRIETVRGDPLFPFVRVMEDLSEDTIYFPGAVRPEGFEDLIDQALGTEDPEQVLDLCMQMERLAYGEIMYVSLWSRPIVTVMKSEIQDVDYSYGEVPYPYFERAWLEK